MANLPNQIHAYNSKYAVQADVTANADGTAVDLLNFSEGPVTVMIPFGTFTGSPTATLTLKESDDNSTYTAIDESTVSIGTADASTLKLIQVEKLKKRYLRLNWSAFTGTTITPRGLIVVGVQKFSSGANGYIAGPSAN